MYGENMYLYPELLTAHQDNDRAVMQAYGFNVKTMTESQCVAELFKLYKEKTKDIQLYWRNYLFDTNKKKKPSRIFQSRNNAPVIDNP